MLPFMYFIFLSIILGDMIFAVCTVRTVNDVLSRSTPLDQKGVDRLNLKGVDRLDLKGVDRLRTSLTVRTVS